MDTYKRTNFLLPFQVNELIASLLKNYIRIYRSHCIVLIIYRFALVESFNVQGPSAIFYLKPFYLAYSKLFGQINQIEDLVIIHIDLKFSIKIIS